MLLFPTLQKNLFWRQTYIKLGFGCTFALNLVIWYMIYHSVEPSIIPIPLHRTVYFGIDFTAPYWYYYFFPLFGLIILVIHFTAAAFCYRDEQILAKLLVATSLLLNAGFGAVAYYLIQFLS